MTIAVAAAPAQEAHSDSAMMHGEQAHGRVSAQSALIDAVRAERFKDVAVAESEGYVWAWKSNPSGAFVNWHPNVSCEAFDGCQNQ